VIGLFKQKSPANIVVLLIFGLLIKMPLFLHPQTIVATEHDGEFYPFLLSLITAPGGSNGFLASVVSFFLLYGQALMLNYLVNEQRMTTRQTFLPAMAYLMVTSLFPEWNYLSAPLVTSALIIWAFIKLFKLYNVQVSSGVVFNIGLVIGLSSFIYFPSLVFVLCIFLGLMILKPFRANEALLVILGILTPYYFYAVYLFLADKFTIKAFLPAVTFHLPQLKSTIWIGIAVLLMGIPFLMGGYYIQNNLRKMLIQARKNWSILLLYLLLSLFIPFINNTDSLQTWVVAAAPFACFHACAYLYPQKKIVPLVVFFLTLAFILFQQYGAPVWSL
jgi:hypothetical protein